LKEKKKEGKKKRDKKGGDAEANGFRIFAESHLAGLAQSAFSPQNITLWIVPRLHGRKREGKGKKKREKEEVASAPAVQAGLQGSRRLKFFIPHQPSPLRREGGEKGEIR